MKYLPYLVPILLGGCNLGCVQSYPKFLDSPQFQAAVIDAYRDGVKTLHAKGEINNPGVRGEAGYFFSLRMEDLHADFDTSVSSGRQPLKKDDAPEQPAERP